MKHTTIPRHEYRAGLAADVAATIERDWSLSKLLRHMLSDEQPDGAEGAVVRHFGDQRGTQQVYGPTHVVPWGALVKRDMTAGKLTAGGALVGLPSRPAADFLRHYSVLTRAGMVTVEGQAANMTVPGIVAPLELTWLGTETSVPAASQPLIGAATATAHIAAGSFNVSGRLIRQAPPGLLDQVLTRHLATAAARAVDFGALQGRMNSMMAEPVGLCALPVLQRYTYGTLGRVAQHAITDAMTYVASRVGDDAACKMIMSPTMRRDIDVGWYSNDLIDGEGRGLWLYGRQVNVSTAAPGGNCIYGDWSTGLLVMFGPGIEVAIDPASNFQKDQITIRVMVAMDSAFPCAANAFAVGAYSST